MAASRGLLKLPSNEQDRKNFLVPRGHNVDEKKNVEPAWFQNLNEAKRWNLQKTFTEWRQRGGLQTPSSKRMFLEHLEQTFGLNRVQCYEFWNYLEQHEKLKDQQRGDVRVKLKEV